MSPAVALAIIFFLLFYYGSITHTGWMTLAFLLFIRLLVSITHRGLRIYFWIQLLFDDVVLRYRYRCVIVELILFEILK